MNLKKKVLSITILSAVSLVILFYCLDKEYPAESIVISEICSRNQRVIYDQTGEYVDYVELFNSTDQTIDISGYILSDKDNNEVVQIIEDTSIKSGEYKVVFVYDFGIADNETIRLLDSSGKEIDTVKIPILAADSAYALDIKKNKWSVMQATPAEINNIAVKSELAINSDIETPVFSAEPGFYDEAFYLEIESSEGTEIYYTLDGTEPDTDSMVYSSPIYIEDSSYKENVYASIDSISTRDDAYIPENPIDKINIIRAIAVDTKNGEKSQESIGSYIEEHYGIQKNNVIMIKNKKVVEGKEDYQLYADVVAFAENNDLSLAQNYEKMKSYIDIQSYIDYYCLTIYVANCDSVVNNYGLWRSRTIKDTGYCDGRWRWILYDTDDSAGMVKLDTMTQVHVNSFFDGYQSKSPMEDVLFTSLFENEEFRNQFAATFVEMAETNFEPNRVSSMIDQLYMEYVEGTVRSHQRYISETYAEDQYWADVYVVRDFFARRQEYILDYLNQTLELYNQ